MNETLLELVRHKTWANLLLLESCERLTPEELNASAPGTYGTIHETLRHLVDSDESYFATITGHRAIPVMSDDATIGDMAQRVRQMSPSWESLVVEADLGTRDILTSDGWRTKGSIPMAQSIHMRTIIARTSSRSSAPTTSSWRVATSVRTLTSGIMASPTVTWS